MIQVSVECPRCKMWKEFIVIPEPVESNTNLLMEKTMGDITNIKADYGTLVCTGCLEDYGIEWIDK